jgi:hypothetical protein
LDFAKVELDLAKEIVRSGEVYLDGQVKLATSADSRAAGLGGMFTAAATALTAGVIALSVRVFAGRLEFMAAGGLTALMFLIGAILCIRSIMPVGFCLSGCEPGKWVDDVQEGRALKDCLGDRATHIQEQISENAQVLELNARLFKWGARMGIAAPFAGLFVWLAIWLSRFGGQF